MIVFSGFNFPALSQVHPILCHSRCCLGTFSAFGLYCVQSSPLFAPCLSSEQTWCPGERAVYPSPPPPAAWGARQAVETSDLSAGVQPAGAAQHNPGGGGAASEPWSGWSSGICVFNAQPSVALKSLEKEYLGPSGTLNWLLFILPSTGDGTYISKAQHHCLPQDSLIPLETCFLICKTGENSGRGYWVQCWLRALHVVPTIAP